ncbi:HRDC domain-containing protein, partial [Alphaproteobacteria bacterium]|nr:HRDC domain-containing protein [Alphaproteobacteria bacterium]
ILFNSYEFKRREEVLSAKPTIIKNKTNFDDIIIEDEELYEKLRKLRLEFAKKVNLPAYVIFPDKSLIEMAKIKPSNSNELSSIYGVGGVKLKKFGKYFLELIKDHRSN